MIPILHLIWKRLEVILYKSSLFGRHMVQNRLKKLKVHVFNSIFASFITLNYLLLKKIARNWWILKSQIGPNLRFCFIKRCPIWTYIKWLWEKVRRGSMIGTATSETKADKNFIGSIDTTFDHQAIKKYLLRPGRALINPFDPSQTTVRWVTYLKKTVSNCY